MAFGFADSDGPLRSRLRILVLDAICIAAGTALGYLSRNNDAVLWPLFVAIAFAVGLAPRTGRVFPLTGRHAAMAFTVAAAIPAAVGPLQIWYVLGVLLVAAVARTVDYLIAGPLPRQPAAPLQLPSGRGGWLRFALAFAGAATAALWIGQTLDPTHTIWVVATTLVVMQADARPSYRRIVERIAGTFAGVFAAWPITFGFPSEAFICACILVVAPLIPHHLANRYWLHTALIAVMILLAYYLAVRDAQGITTLLSGTGHRHVARLRHRPCRHRSRFPAPAGSRARQLGRRNSRSRRAATPQSPGSDRQRGIGLTAVCIAGRGIARRRIR